MIIHKKINQIQIYEIKDIKVKYEICSNQALFSRKSILNINSNEIYVRVSNNNFVWIHLKILID